MTCFQSKKCGSHNIIKLYTNLNIYYYKQKHFITETACNNMIFNNLQHNINLVLTVSWSARPQKGARIRLYNLKWYSTSALYPILHFLPEKSMTGLKILLIRWYPYSDIKYRLMVLSCLYTFIFSQVHTVLTWTLSHTFHFYIFNLLVLIMLQQCEVLRWETSTR